MTTKEELGGKWKTISGAVKKKYDQITDIDLKQVEGDFDRLAGLIQRKTGQTRKEIETFYEECCDGADGVMDQVSQLASGASEAVREGYDQVTEQTRHGYEETVKAVAQNPVSALGIALAVGGIFGLMMGLSIGAQRERALTWRDRWNR